MEGHFSTGQNPQWAGVPMEEEECSAQYKFETNHSLLPCLVFKKL